MCAFRYRPVARRPRRPAEQLVGRGGGGAIWTPLALSTKLAIWKVGEGMFSDEGVTPVVADDPVRRWTAIYPLDGSIYFDQATLALRPIYKIGANGKPYVTFSNQYMQCPSGTSGFCAGNESNDSLFALCKRTATGSFMAMLSSDNVAGTAGIALAYSSSVPYVAYGNSYRNMLGDASVWHTYASKWLWDGSKNVGTPYYNGTAAPDTGSGAENTTQASNGEFAIGARTGGANRWTGHIAGYVGICSPFIPADELALLDAVQQTLVPT